MAKKAYIGVGNVAKKIKKGYIGVGNVAKKIKKAYIGVGGGVTYRQVAYIQSTGTQYIDTGFAPKFSTRVVVDISDLGTNTAFVFGERNADSEYASEAYNVLRTSATTVRSDYFGSVQTLTISTATGSSRTTIDKNKNVTTMFGSSVTNSAVSSGTAGRSLYLFAINNSGSAQYHGSFKLYSCQIYDNGTLIRDYVPVLNPSGTPGLFDKVSKQFCANAGGGNFTAGAETGATHVSNSTARPCFGQGKPTYYGTATALTQARSRLDATNVGNYALFAGGYYSTNYRSVVESYNSSLTRGTPTELSVGRSEIAAVKIGNYALFAGGNKASTNGTKNVDAYDAALTKTNPTELAYHRFEAGSACVGNYAVIASGRGQFGSNTSTVETYNSSLTRGDATGLDKGWRGLMAASVGEYALFTGGYSNPYYDEWDDEVQDTHTYVETYNTSLTKGRATDTSTQLGTGAGVSVGSYALFGGGGYYNYKDAVNAYNTSLTRTIPTALSTARSGIEATSLGDFAIFGTGRGSSGWTKDYDVYDASLTKTTLTRTGNGCYFYACTSVGDYALFGGGSDSVESTIATVYVLALV